MGVEQLVFIRVVVVAMSHARIIVILLAVVDVI